MAPEVKTNTVRITPPGCTCWFGTLEVAGGVDDTPPTSITVVAVCRACEARQRATKHEPRQHKRPRPPALRLDGRRRRR